MECNPKTETSNNIAHLTDVMISDTARQLHQLCVMRVSQGHAMLVDLVALSILAVHSSMQSNPCIAVAPSISHPSRLSLWHRAPGLEDVSATGVLILSWGSSTAYCSDMGFWQRQVAKD
jgi:hypothetical protein